MSQQPVSVVVSSGNLPQQQTIIQTVSQSVLPVTTTHVDRLPYLSSHRILGIMQMVVGPLCFLVEIIGFCVGIPAYFYRFYGAGIYTGITFFITGLLGYMAFKKNHRCMMATCMAMNIIGSCVAIIGLIFASIEVSQIHWASSDKAGYQKFKNGLIIASCIFEFVLTIVHASFTCASCCECCWPRQTVLGPSQVTGTVVVAPHSYQAQGQVYQFQGHAPQQYPAQQPQWPVQYQPQNYPQSHLTEGAYPQQNQDYNMAANPTFAHDSPLGGIGDPPPYSETYEKQ